MKRKIRIIFMVFCGILFSSKNVYAYLDPGSGSYILQILIGVLLGGALAMKLFWSKIKLFFKNLFCREKKQ